MTLLMAGEDSPTFHDFLGLSRAEETKNDPIVPEIVPTSRKDKGYDKVEGEASTRPVSVNTSELDTSSGTINAGGSVPGIFPPSSDPNSGHFSSKMVNLQHHGNKCVLYKAENDGPAGKKRDNSDTRYSQQDANQTNAETPVSHSMKVSRPEGQDAKKSRHQASGTEDFHVVMQPPRSSLKGLAMPPSTMFKADLSSSKSKKWDSFGQVGLNPGMLGQTQNIYVGVQSEKMPGKCWRESIALTSQAPPLPPADEGSRTGLKVSNVSSILNNSSGTHAWGSVRAAECPGNSSVLSHGTGMRYQTLARTSRQLTIFYGGQAHVFDDVQPDKVEAIMALAGSGGRSWSTAYSCGNRGNLVSSSSEAVIPVSEREGERISSRGCAINGFSSSALSSEMHIAQITPTKVGPGGCNSIVSTNPTHFSQIPSDIRVATERQESVVMHSVNVNGAHKEV